MNVTLDTNKPVAVLFHSLDAGELCVATDEMDCEGAIYIIVHDVNTGMKRVCNILTGSVSNPNVGFMVHPLKQTNTLEVAYACSTKS